MIGVVIWCKADPTRAIVWCEDQQDLAFVDAETKYPSAELLLSIGDQIQFKEAQKNGLRHVREVTQHFADGGEKGVSPADMLAHGAPTERRDRFRVIVNDGREEMAEDAPAPVLEQRIH